MHKHLLLSFNVCRVFYTTNTVVVPKTKCRSNAQGCWQFKNACDIQLVSNLFTRILIFEIFYSVLDFQYSNYGISSVQKGHLKIYRAWLGDIFESIICLIFTIKYKIKKIIGTIVHSKKAIAIKRVTKKSHLHAKMLTF